MWLLTGITISIKIINISVIFSTALPVFDFLIS